MATSSPRPEDWLVGGGEMGKVIRSMDWSTTPLGPISSWPQSLRTAVSLGLASNFPISLAWGPQRVQIYNDGYWPICGGKHPQAMGQDFRVCWASAWPAVGEAFERALVGQTSFLENQRMFLDRNGYLEETFFTFSFSPIRDESGGVGGLFHPVTEVTSKMLGERRIRALRDLAAREGQAHSVEESFHLAAEVLSECALDVPFALFYVLDARGGGARLTAWTGLPAGGAASPSLAALSPVEHDGWPLGAVVGSRQVLEVPDLAARFPRLVCRPYPEPLKTAFLLPITPPGAERPAGFVVAGASPRLPLDVEYRAFFDLLAAGLTTSVANACAYQAERARAEALAELDRAKSMFFSNISHEFRTPLTLILGPVEDALLRPDRALAGADLVLVRRNALRLYKMVNALLDFSRLEAGRAQATFVPTDLSALTADLASAFRSTVEAAGIALVVDCAPLPEPVFVDPDLWDKIVLNLLSNAAKYTYRGEIGVRVRWEAEAAVVTVSDTGVGIAGDELPRIFERFYRVRGSQGRSHEGTGIGLALVQELVELHGGTVAVESVLDRGTTFTLRIPRGAAHLPPDRVDRAPRPHSSAAQATFFTEEARRWSCEDQADDEAPRPGGALASVPEVPDALASAHILVADDNADLRSYVAGLLTPAFRRVEVVADGLKALAAARRTPPDLILSDVMMPGLDGFGLVRELRADERTRAIPIVLLSARAGSEATVEGLESGADDYLVKPFSARELMARVRTQLEMARVRFEVATARARVDELGRAVAARDSFLSIASHELRTPLTAMQLQLQTAARLAGEGVAGDDDLLRQRLAKALQASGRLERLVTDLLDISRITMGQLVLEHREFDAAEAVTAVVARSAEAARQAGSELQVEVVSVVGTWDRARLEQVVANLLGNALKYGCGKPIRIALARRDDSAVLMVKDQGIGIPAEDQRRIFERFERAVSPRHYGGFGLGLWVVRQLVEALGGHIQIESAPDRGAAFTVSLPRHPSAPHAAAVPAAPEW